MNNYIKFLILMFLPLISACSGSGTTPVSPMTDQKNALETLQKMDNLEVISDVLYSYSSKSTYAYKAFGIVDVSIEPSTSSGEILSTRNSASVGDTFDADLTQFLTVNPCHNCIQLDGITLLGNNQVQVGFAIKHPFPSLQARPDLNVFDVRGIVIAKGNAEFPLTKVKINVSSEIPARLNTNLLSNPDGFTSHFDGLAENLNYFNPPRDYNANINPFKRYFVNPMSNNALEAGSPWESQNYIFNYPDGTEPINFAFVVDCSYGQSATYIDRSFPHYFLPEFNRKEAWKANVFIVSNDLQSGQTSSSAQIQVEVCDWQAGRESDPGYPDLGNLGGISAKSDVASVELELPGVHSGIAKATTPTSGTGAADDPYVYKITVTNAIGAYAGDYYGIVAVRDDLQGKIGPKAIPASPEGFPFPGPEIVDYSVYQVFSIRVNGELPEVVGSLGITGNPIELLVSGQYAFVCTGSGVKVVDVSNPINPFIISTIQSGGSRCIAISGNYAYIAGYHPLPEFQIWDISDLETSVLIGGSSTGDFGDSYYLAVSGSYAFVSDYTSKIKVMDVSDPDYPKIVDQDFSIPVNRFTVSGNYLYVGGGNEGLIIVNVSNPYEPFRESTLNTGYAHAVKVSGAYACVSSRDKGMAIVNVSNPQTPVLLGSIDTNGDSIDMAISGNFAYLADGIAGLRIIYVGNPRVPDMIYSVETGGCASDVEVSGNYAYIINGSTLKIIELWD